MSNKRFEFTLDKLTPADKDQLLAFLRMATYTPNKQTQADSLNLIRLYTKIVTRWPYSGDPADARSYTDGKQVGSTSTEFSLWLIERGIMGK